MKYYYLTASNFGPYVIGLSLVSWFPFFRIDLEAGKLF